MTIEEWEKGPRVVLNNTWNTKKDNVKDTIKGILSLDDLKNRVIFELERSDFPNLEFLLSEEVLDEAKNILEDLLEEAKKEFNELLNTSNEDITFEAFSKKSKLSYFRKLLQYLNLVNSNKKIRSVINSFWSKITDFHNEKKYSKRYFDILKYLIEKGGLNEEQEKILNDAIRDFKIRWIELSKEKQEELKIINKRLSKLWTKFSNNVMDSKKEFEYFLETDEFLKELPETDLENARIRAEKKWKKWYLFDASMSSYISIIDYCSDSGIRKYFMDTFNSFASSWKLDNRKIVLEIINLKNKKAKILGYNNYAELSLEHKMADSPEQILDLIIQISEKARAKALDETNEIKDFFNLDKLELWDIFYYSRILREKKYNYDDKKLKEYFEFNNTKQAIFDTVEKLYWLKMVAIDVDGKHDENVEIYEVYKDGKLISYFLWDYFYNENKRSWAWASELRKKHNGKIPIVSNTMNFMRSESSDTLLTLWEVITMAHEFGHAIHSMLSKSEYSELTGFWVEWDFIELPSQLLEKWVSERDTIVNIGKHYKTWERIPEDLLENMEKLKHFGKWLQIINQCVYGIVDMMFFSGEYFESVEDLEKFFLENVNKFSIFQRDNNYKMYTSFSHIFSWPYSAGYYWYMWANIIVDEIWVKFKEKWIYDKEFAAEFLDKILWAGSIRSASEMFYDLMWRGVESKAFLKEKWLI